jgi:hypothetical protein
MTIVIHCKAPPLAQDHGRPGPEPKRGHGSPYAEAAALEPSSSTPK